MDTSPAAASAPAPPADHPLIDIHDLKKRYVMGSEEVWALDGITLSIEEGEYVAILGPSGCGKSSLARAGLIPALAQRPVLGKAQMRVAVMVPGSHPLEALAGVLAKTATQDPMPVTKTREFAQELGIATPAGSYDGLRRIASLIPQIHDAPLVVLVDQFEEVYSLCKDTDERQAFIDNLLTAAQDPSGQVSVVITLRSDFLGETQRHPGLNQIIGSDQSAIVPAMTTEELRRAIAEPAKRAGHPLDEATVDLLVQDTEGREGALPLLQFALTRIWEGLGEGKAPAETYRQMGGVGGALAGKAQAIYDQLSPAEQIIARRIFLGLVQLGEGTRDTRRRAPVESLIASQDSPEAVKQVLARFSSPGSRLVTLASQGAEEVAEVTHEALFGYWQPLNDWLDSSRDDIRFQRRLEVAAEYWQEQGKPAGLLWRPPDLDRLRTFVRQHRANMTARCLDFFTAADRAEQRQRGLKQLGIVGLTVGLMLTTYQMWRAERRQMNLYATTAEALAESDPLESMVNGLAAIGMGRNPFIKLPRLWGDDLVSSAVLDLGNRNARFTSVFGHRSPAMIVSVAFSPDGETIASGGLDGTVRLWDRQGQLLLIAELGRAHQGWVSSMSFSPDGETIASGGSDGTVRLWDRQGQPIADPFQGHQGSVSSVTLSPDGEIIANGGEDGTVRLWNRQGQAITEPLQGHEDRVRSVTFSPDGKTIASGSDDGTVRLWDYQGQPIGEPFQNRDGGAWVVVFSPDGETIASGGRGGEVRLWDRQGQLIIEPFRGDSFFVRSVAFSPDGESIVSGGNGGTVRLWDRQGQLIAELFQSYEDWVNFVAFSPDGKTIASGGNFGTVRLWNRKSQPVAAPIQGHRSGIYSIALSPDGETIAGRDGDRTIRLWDRQGQLIEEPFQDNQGLSNPIAFSPDGEIIASWDQDDTVRLWDRQGQPIEEPLEGHQDWVISMTSRPDIADSSVALSPDGEIITSGTRDGTIELRNRQGQLITEPFQAHTFDVYSLAFSPDGKTIASGGYDGTVRLWDRQGQPIAEPFEGHQSEVWSVAFSPDGETVVSGSQDGTVRLWPVWLAEVGWVTYTCDRIRGYLLARSGEDETVRLARRTCERHAWR